MSNEDANGSGSDSGATSGRSPRQGIGGSPVGSTVSIVLAVVAVIAGFLILRNITDDGGGSSDAGSSASDEADDATSTTLGDLVEVSTTVAPSTTAPLVTEGATVIVANANTVGGSAGRMSTALEQVGFTMGDPANATLTLEVSKVQFDGTVASAEAVAESVARVMGGIAVEAVPTPPPIDGGDLGGAGVLLLLGNGEADKTLDELSAAAEGTPATGTAPAPSGSDAATTVAPTTTTGG